MAEKRGDGGPPDGHDPEARPDSAPLLANFISVVDIVIVADYVSSRFSNRHAILDLQQVIY